MGLCKDETGKRYGKLVGIRYTRSAYQGGAYWLYSCDCGKIVERRANTIRRAIRGIVSCGCTNNRKVNDLNRSKFHRSYYNMKMRCSSPKHTKYKYYGGRGIKCFWDTFKDFRTDMYQSYLEHEAIHGAKNTTLDRIDVDGHYTKRNCRWATLVEQANNKRNNVRLKSP